MIKFGADVLIAQDPVWKTQRIALVTNVAATTNQYQQVTTALLAAGFNLVKLFSPEHGFDAKGADGAKMENSTDAVSLLPVVSLYGDHLAPTSADLADIDIVLFDIPDIGVRFYTYLWTLTYVMESCTAYGKPLVILDRPNPISGNLQLCEGPMLDEQHFSSFIGRWSIPLRHSCTLGELALFFNASKNIKTDLKIIPCENWDRNSFQPDWGIDFIPTSPAIRGFSAAMLYPGLGLLEATNISEGRGTGMPFQIAAAPWMKEDVTKELDEHITIENIKVIPTEGNYAGIECTGIYFKLNQYEGFKSVQHGMLLLKLIKDQYPEHFKWSIYPTNVNPTGAGHLGKLLGIQESEKIFELPLQAFKSQLTEVCSVASWKKQMVPFLLYH
uniref:exo-beta-N-acetylmuramidase NamZ family protein n=1 Tax=Pedobacter schmidteae TaxID=2201271 RepID=UPI000EB3B073|nr:DUF1343 domain-containing protein [Pedobacter schmidteae]